MFYRKVKVPFLWNFTLWSHFTERALSLNVPIFPSISKWSFYYRNVPLELCDPQLLICFLPPQKSKHTDRNIERRSAFHYIKLHVPKLVNSSLLQSYHVSHTQPDVQISYSSNPTFFSFHPTWDVSRCFLFFYSNWQSATRSLSKKPTQL